MRATTAKYKQIIAGGNSRKFVVKIDLTLADSNINPTVLHLTEADIWYDSFKIETASSGNGSFDIGTAIIGQCKFSLNNIDERFNQFDFFNATAVVWVGLEGDTNTNDEQIYYRMGFFTVDEPTFAGSLIQLVCLDNMWKFDVPFKNVSISYPITARNLVVALCSYCGVTLQTQQFHGYNFTISSAPENKDDMNCREVLQYVAMLGCNFCVINNYGDLEIKWYDTTSMVVESDLNGGSFDTNTTPYSDGDNADGGNFLDYSSGDNYDGGSFNFGENVAYFTRNFQLSLGTDVITITGLKIVIDKTEYTVGNQGYRLELENPFITASNVNSALNSIWSVLHPDNNTYFSFRTFNLTTVADLAPEVGDFCAIKDYKDNYVYSWITNNVFAFANHQVHCDAVPPTRNLTKQYSKTVQTAVDQARAQTNQQISNYDLAVQRMNQLAANASGLYWIEVPQSDGTSIYYESDSPLSINSSGQVVFTNHSHVWKRTSSGFFSTTSSGTSESTTTWTGGIDANNNAVMNTVSTIGISFDWAHGGTLTLGGDNNVDGVLVVKDRYDTVIGRWDKDGISVTKGVIESIGDRAWLAIEDGTVKGGYGTTIGQNQTQIYFDQRVDNQPGWIGQKAKGIFFSVDKICVTTHQGDTTGWVAYDGSAVIDVDLSFDEQSNYVRNIDFERDYNYVSDLSFNRSSYFIVDGTLDINFNNRSWSYDSQDSLGEASWNNSSVITGANWTNSGALNGWHSNVTSRNVTHGIVT